MGYDNGFKRPGGNDMYSRFHDPERYKAKHSYNGRERSAGAGDGYVSEDSAEAYRARYVAAGYAVPPHGDPATPNGADARPPSRKKKHVGAKVIIGILAIFIVASAFFAVRIDAALHSFPAAEQKSLDAELSPSALMGLQPVNILLLGTDARQDDPELGARTDAIVLARVDPNTQKVSMVSLPRDTLVNLPEVGVSKLNAAYTFGGPDGAVRAVEELCGVKVDHCVLVDFEGLCGLVDKIGGIDVYLDEPIDNPKAGSATLPAGQQHINGEQALVMSRDRDYVDGDYSRQSNQRKVISGILHRIMSMPLWEMPAAMEGCAACVSADSGTGAIGLSLLALRLKVPWAHMALKMAVLPSQPADIGGISYVVADRAATAELMGRLVDGGDIEAPVSVSSIDEDVVAAENL